VDARAGSEIVRHFLAPGAESTVLGAHPNGVEKNQGHGVDGDGKIGRDSNSASMRSISARTEPDGEGPSAEAKLIPGSRRRAPMANAGSIILPDGDRSQG